MSLPATPAPGPPASGPIDPVATAVPEPAPASTAATTLTGAAPWPARLDRRRPWRPEVTVILPTYNEAANLPVLLERLDLTLAHLDYEIVVVDDDSPDGTWRVAEEHASRSPRIRVLRRVGRRGLSSAVVEGMAMAQGRVLAVMDADLQHDEAVLPRMVAAVSQGGAEVCVATRATDEGSYGSFGPLRRLVSEAGTVLAHQMLGVQVSDPMSGYFAVSRARYERVRGQLSGRGFKILLEVLALGPRPRVAEVGYRFRERAAGTTKLSSSVGLAYLASVAELAVARLVASRYPHYLAVALMAVALRATLGRVPVVAGLAGAATEAAIVAEFALHGSWTFHPAATRGWRWLGPLVRFHLVAGYGLLASRGVRALVDGLVAPGPGGRPAGIGATVGALALAGGGVAAVATTSFLLNRQLTWPRRRPEPVPTHG